MIHYQGQQYLETILIKQIIKPNLRKKYRMFAQSISNQTQKNWWIDAALFTSALAAILSGIYFLFLPAGGFQGGRNPLYGVHILFDRHTWDDLHTWGGVAMITAAIVHLLIHWNWVTSMARRIWHEMTGKCGCMNARGRWNLILNSVVALSFILSAVSGVYFLFVPGGRWAVDPGFLFARSTWDLVHTWSSVIFITAALLHFVIHWKWVTKVTRKMIGLVLPIHPASRQAPVTN
jgi:hypothetical protein